jgi:pimeloyl-ACP methyl ester carboxylesterase
MKTTAIRKPVILLFVVASAPLLIAMSLQSKSASRAGTARAADGVAIKYEVQGKGDPALVFIHGYTSDLTAWREQMADFAREHRVVAVDLGGHGGSGANREQWSIAGLAGDVEAVVKALGLKQVVLVGHSMGGPVALFAAARMPDRVAGIIGVDTLHDAEFKWPADTIKDAAAKMEADFNGMLRGSIQTMFLETADPALVKEITEKALLTNRKAALGILHDFGRVDLKSALAAAKKPVRCINASAPRMAPLTAVETNCKYADYKAVTMDGVGHYLMIERPAEFNKLMREALKELMAK